MRPYFLTIAALLAAPAAAADYALSVQGRPIGTMKVDGAPGRRTIAYETGGDRGLKGRTVVELDPNGLVSRLDYSGKSALTGDQFERFEAKDGRATWVTGIDEGKAPAGAFYNALGSNAEHLAILARALLDAPGGRLPLLPSGEASISKADRIEIATPAGPAAVDLYLISGLSKRPAAVWLDRSRELVARVAGAEITTLRTDLPADAAARLLQVQESTLATADERLARDAADRPSGPVLIRNANLFDSKAARMRPRTSILVRGDRIVAVAPDSRMKAPLGARIVDAGGRALLPGLWDSHVHMFDPAEAVMTLASGVTSVRDMGNDGKLTSEWHRRFEAGELLGPRLFRAAVVDGPNQGTVPWANVVKDEGELERLVDRLAAEGYGTIKLFNSLPEALALALVKRAHARGLIAGGHLPRTMRMTELIAAGLDESTHLDFFAMQFVGPYRPEDTPGPKRVALLAERSDRIDLRSPEVGRMLGAMRRGRMSLDPTATNLELMMRDAPGRPAGFIAPFAGRLPGGYVRGMVGLAASDPAARARSEAALVKALALLGKAAEAGIPIVAGGDGEPGIMVARELELYVEAGMTPLQALQTATINPARRLGVAERLGSIEPGKQADLILVDGRPDRKVGDVREVVMVMKGGIIHDVARLSAHVGMRPSSRLAEFEAAGGASNRRAPATLAIPARN